MTDLTTTIETKSFSEMLNIESPRYDEVWGKKAFLNIHQCTCLCLDVDPLIVTPTKLTLSAASGDMHYQKLSQKYEALRLIIESEFDTPDDLARYNGKVRLIYQNPASNNLRRHVEITTDFFIEWIERNDIIELPEKFIEAVEQIAQRQLSYNNLKLKNEALTAQLQETQVQVQGVSINEIIQAECYTTKLQQLLLATVNLWVAFRNGKLKKEPQEQDIVAALTAKGYSNTLAKSAATIIKPEWAHVGRPEKV